MRAMTSSRFCAVCNEAIWRALLERTGLLARRGAVSARRSLGNDDEDEVEVAAARADGRSFIRVVN